MEVSGMNLKSVAPTQTVTPDGFDVAIKILGVLKYHGELPRDERGVAPATIRRLLGKFVPSCNGMLCEYICAFGANGIPVIKRHLARLCEDNQTLVDSIEEKANAAYKQVAGALWGADLTKV